MWLSLYVNSGQPGPRPELPGFGIWPPQHLPALAEERPHGVWQLTKAQACNRAWHRVFN